MKEKRIIMRTVLHHFVITLVLLSLAVQVPVAGQTREAAQKTASFKHATMKTDTATFAAGCFWCVEAIYQGVKGVQKVVSGYSGGNVPHPTYEAVCTGSTGHAEATEIVFDPSVVSFVELLEIFWQTHDPTTLNRQGADIGTQYRSAIFYHSEEQKKLAEEYKKKLDAAGAFSSPIVTEITPCRNFYPAEDYHQDYYNQHGSQPYCQIVIRPKLEKFRKVFKDKLASPH